MLPPSLPLWPNRFRAFCLCPWRRARHSGEREQNGNPGRKCERYMEHETQDIIKTEGGTYEGDLQALPCGGIASLSCRCSWRKDGGQPRPSPMSLTARKRARQGLTRRRYRRFAGGPGLIWFEAVAQCRKPAPAQSTADYPQECDGQASAGGNNLSRKICAIDHHAGHQQRQVFQTPW